MFEKFREMLGGRKATESSENSLGGSELFALIKKREESMDNRSEGSNKEAKFEALFDLTKRIERLSEKRQGEKTERPSAPHRG